LCIFKSLLSIITTPFFLEDEKLLRMGFFLSNKTPHFKSVQSPEQFLTRSVKMHEFMKGGKTKVLFLDLSSNIIVLAFLKREREREHLISYVFYREFSYLFKHKNMSRKFLFLVRHNSANFFLSSSFFVDEIKWWLIFIKFVDVTTPNDQKRKNKTRLTSFKILHLKREIIMHYYSTSYCCLEWLLKW